MNKKASGWWTLFWIILFIMIMTSAIRNSYYRHAMYDDLYRDQMRDELQQQQQEDLYEDLYRNQMRDDIMHDAMYDDLYRDQMRDELQQQSGNYYPRESEPLSTSVIVSYVQDGDTFKLSTGENIRLIGLNAPESGQSCSSEATTKLKEFVLRKEVVLKKDIDDKDQYGRLLRYVYINGTFINLEMVWLGLAHKYEYGSNTKYSSQFEQAENEAKQNKSCLWKTSQESYINDQCIHILNFHFNAAGDDNYNLNDEYIVFGNKCSYSIEMTDWTIKDETASHSYKMPPFTFQSEAMFRLYTGTGTNTNSALYWGKTSGNYAAIWNNGGDTLFLRDSNGNFVLSKSYP